MNQFSSASRWQAIYEEGESLHSDIAAHFERLAAIDRVNRDAEWVPEDPRLYDRRRVTSELRDRAHVWFNKVGVEVLPHTTFHRDYLNKLLRRVNASIGGKRYFEAHAVYGYDEE